MSSQISVLQNVTASDIHLTPFPHLVVRGALPEALYADLAANFPSLESVAGKAGLPNNTLFLRAAEKVVQADDIAPLWREYFAYHTSGKFFDEIVGLWGDTILRLYPDIEERYGAPLSQWSLGLREAGQEENRANYANDLQMDCQFAVNSPVTEVSSVRGPHIDRRHKLFASLLYLPRPGDEAGGNLTLCRYKDPALAFDPERPIPLDFVERSPFDHLGKIPLDAIVEEEVIPYGANTLVMWLNTPYSLHGVTPRRETGQERRYVNMIAEAYSSKADGLFQLKKKTLVRRLFG